MLKLFVIVSFALVLFLIPVDSFAQVSWHDSTMSYRQSITIDDSKVSGNDNFSDYPILVSISNSNLKSANVQSDGADIRFYDSSGNSLSFEIESFSNNSSSGSITAWVNIPTLSSSADTIIYLYHGNDSSTDGQTTNNVWSNYWSVWHLAESSGELKDSTSNANHLTGVNSPTRDAVGKIDKAISFDGNNDYLTNSNPTLPIGDSPYTIEAWMMLTGTGGHGIAGWGNYGGTKQVNAFRTDGNTKLVNYWWGSDFRKTVPNLQNGFHHVAVTYDGSQREIYVDGISYGVKVGSGLNVPNTDNFRIGSTNSGEYMNGILDEVRVSSVAQSSDHILTQYNNQNSPSSFYSVGSLDSRPSNNSTVPSSPTGLTLSIQSASQINLSWTAPSNGGSSITGYQIERSVDGTSYSVIVANTDSTNTSFSNTGLSSNTTYHYQISAINNVGTGASSSSVSSTTHANTGTDTTPPSITPPADITIPATGTLTPVNIGTATATDDTDSNPTITNDAPSSFPIGITIVTWTATDNSGNSSTATQRVTITQAITPSTSQSATGQINSTINTPYNGFTFTQNRTDHISFSESNLESWNDITDIQTPNIQPFFFPLLVMIIFGLSFSAGVKAKDQVNSSIFLTLAFLMALILILLFSGNMEFGILQEELTSNINTNTGIIQIAKTYHSIKIIPTDETFGPIFTGVFYLLFFVSIILLVIKSILIPVLIKKRAEENNSK